MDKYGCYMAVLQADRWRDPTLTEHQARARVWASDPELRRRYDEERSVRIDKLVA